MYLIGWSHTVSFMIKKAKGNFANITSRPITILEDYSMLV